MIYLILVAIGLIGYGVLNTFQKRTAQKDYEKYRKELNTFKERADQMQVDLSKLNLKSNEWQEEVVTNDTKYGGYNQLAGRGDLNIEKVQHSLNVLEANVKYEGQTIDVLCRVNMDTKTLKMKLAIQGETTLYVNPEKPDEHYLDLDFLYS